MNLDIQLKDTARNYYPHNPKISEPILDSHVDHKDTSLTKER